MGRWRRPERETGVTPIFAPGLRALAVSGLVATAATAGCALPGGSDSPFDHGMAHLAHASFPAADSALRAVASRCDNGDDRGAALLLLASLHQDPRNREAHPDSAALMAARYLYLPSGSDENRRLAEGLYVQALDRGGNPGLRPEPGFRALAPGVGCGRSATEVDGVPPTLPVLPDPSYARRLGEAQRRLDSLSAVHRANRARLQEVETELARLKRLLQIPDSLNVPGPRPE